MKRLLKTSVISLLTLSIFSACTPSSYTFTLTLKNISENYELNEGVYFLHGSDTFFNFEGQEANESLKSLLKNGDTQPFINEAEEREDIFQAFTIPAVAPGAEVSIEITAPFRPDDGVFISGYQPIKDTDNYIYLGGGGLYDFDDVTPTESTFAMKNYDAGLDESTVEEIQPVFISTDINMTISQLIVVPQQ